MIAESQVMDKILIEVRKLSPEYRIRLIQRISEMLVSSQPKLKTHLQYGKYSGGKQSTPEDFTIAEWHPADNF